MEAEEVMKAMQEKGLHAWEAQECDSRIGLSQSGADKCHCHILLDALWILHLSCASSRIWQ
jgi:hypothetical protein